MVKPAWWAPVLPATGRLACANAQHELRWSGGELTLPDHADVQAEDALRALGGEAPACITLAKAWRDHMDDPVLVTLGRRPGESDIGLDASGVPDRRGAASGSPSRRDGLLMLFGLEAPLIDRLVLTAAAAAAERWTDSDFRQLHGLRLGAALAARATPALRRLGSELVRADESLVVHATPAAPGEPSTVKAERTDAGLEVIASMELGWVSAVWGPGISEPSGRMVLAVRSAAEEGRLLGVDVAEWRNDGVDHWEAAAIPGVLVGDGAAWQLDLG